MQPERKPWPVFLFLGILGLAAQAAVAQDYPGEPQASRVFAWQPHLGDFTLAPVAGEMGELSLYLHSPEEDYTPLPPRTFMGKAPSPGPSRLILFTRLAGMFMGRVSALSIGNVRVCFKLELL